MVDVNQAIRPERLEIPEPNNRWMFGKEMTDALRSADQALWGSSEARELAKFEDQQLSRQLELLDEDSRTYLDNQASFFDKQLSLGGDTESARRVALLFELMPKANPLRLAFEPGSNKDNRNLVLRREFQDLRSHLYGIYGPLGSNKEERQQRRRVYLSSLVVAYAESRIGGDEQEIASSKPKEGDNHATLRKAIAGTVVAVTLLRGPIASAAPVQSTPVTQELSTPSETVINSRIEALEMTQAETTRIKSLTPEMQVTALDIIESARAGNPELNIPALDVHISSGARTPEEQAALYAQGRTQDQINAKADELASRGFPQLAEVQRSATAQPAAGQVTNAAAGQSIHSRTQQGGQAFDVVININGSPAPSNSPVWQQYGALVNSPQFDSLVEWGGDFTSIADYGHVQRSGISVDSLMRIIEDQLGSPGVTVTVPQTTTSSVPNTVTPNMSLDDVRAQAEANGSTTATTGSEAGAESMNYPAPRTAEDYARVFAALAANDQIERGGSFRGDDSTAGQLFEAHKQEFLDGAAQLGISPDVALGVFLTESSGDGFGPDGRIKIRVETDNINEEYGTNIPDQHENGLPDTQEEEWQALVDARRALEAIGEDADHADEWTSWGGPQILGLHYDTLGYRDVHAMELAFEDEDNQVAGFFTFVSNMSQEAKDALRNGDMATFGHSYNGSWGYGDILARNIEQARQAINN